MLFLLFHAVSLRADELLYRYEGDTFPFDKTSGWVIADACEGPCVKSLQNGHFILTWENGGNQVNYDLLISNDAGEPPLPKTLWVEWNFRSNHPHSPIFPGCDGTFVVRYIKIFDLLRIFGDSVFSFSGSDSVLGLNMNDFHTYRFESLDGVNYKFSVDGMIFIETFDNKNSGGAYLQMHGVGGCDPELQPTINEWDFVRYGTINDGESIVASDPPEGIVDSHLIPGFDRFTITFDQPGYIFINDVTVETTGGVIPTVIQTRRLDNGDPETLQIVLDRTLFIDESVTFTFSTGGSPNTVTYTYRLTGACCLSDDTCTITTDLECIQAAGTFHPSQPCSSLQACCLPDRTCQMLDPLCCEDRGGTLQGENSECTTVVTCCFSGNENTCQNLDPLCCQEQGGISRSNPFLCEGDLDNDGLDGSCGDFCPNDPGKITPGFCGCGNSETDSDSDTVPDCVDQCPGEDDRIDDNFNNIPDCIDNFEFIPTLSTWGLVIMVLLLLITYKLIFNYSYPPAKE